METYEIIGLVFGIGTFLLQIDLLIVLFAFIFYPNGWITRFVGKYSLYIITLFGLFSLMGSLTYSEFLKFDPCKLCWIQRIFLYPSFIIGIVAIWRKDLKALWYTLSLAIVGVIFSLYHYIIQFAPVSESLPCSYSGGGGCGGIFTIQMGYITIPMMALTLFLYVILVSVIGIKHDKKNS